MDFVRILEASGSEASLDYPDYPRDQMHALDTLAAYYVIQVGNALNQTVISFGMLRAEIFFRVIRRKIRIKRKNGKQKQLFFTQRQTKLLCTTLITCLVVRIFVSLREKLSKLNNSLISS